MAKKDIKEIRQWARKAKSEFIGRKRDGLPAGTWQGHFGYSGTKSTLKNEINYLKTKEWVSGLSMEEKDNLKYLETLQHSVNMYSQRLRELYDNGNILGISDTAMGVMTRIKESQWAAFIQTNGLWDATTLEQFLDPSAIAWRAAAMNTLGDDVSQLVSDDEFTKYFSWMMKNRIK